MRYWYQEMSQATVSTTSLFVPESGTIEAFGIAEALRDPRDRSPEGALVEEVGRLDHRQLGPREPAQDRLVHDAARPGGLRDSNSDAETRPSRLRRRSDDHGRGRAALLQPAVVERDLLAERADVDEVLAVGRIAHRALADEQGPLADRARAQTR